jgi:hypothetical protein
MRRRGEQKPAVSDSSESIREQAGYSQIAGPHACQYRSSAHAIVEGELNTPLGRRPRVRTVWQFDEGTIAPRLITAYPLENS